MEALRVHRDTAGSLEIDRIIGLPVIPELLPLEVEVFSEQEIQARYFEDGFRLFPVQAASVLAYDTYGGLFGPVGVGWGKTLITLMIADRALRKGIERSMLFVPSQVYSQLTNTDIQWARKRVGLRVPFMLMGGKSRQERHRIASSGKKGCYVFPYSLLSTRDTDEILNLISPGLLMLDEVHNVKNMRAARTKRLFGPDGYVTRNCPEIVALSGTITSKSIRDYGHLISHALREWSPLPMEFALIEQWAQALDAGADPGDAQTGPMRPLLKWFRTHWPTEKLPPHISGYRKAYNRRLTTCPGVVSTGDAEIGTSLTFENLPVKGYKSAEGFQELNRLMDQVEDLWLTPSGDEIDWGFHKWRYLYELSSGFYHNLRWPTIPELMRRAHFSRLTEHEVEAYLEQAKACHEARNEFNKKLRRWIQYRGRSEMDTPFLITSNMHTYEDRDVGAELYNAWRAAKDLEFEGMPERLSEPILVCDYKIKHAVEWAKKYGKGLVWYLHDALGEWTSQAMLDAGVDALWCPAESRRKGMNDQIRDPANKDRVLVSSAGGHGTGKNLQHHSNSLMLQFFRQSDTFEQVLGRIHRNGQLEDELIVHFNNTLEFDDLNASACIIDALYQHQTVGTRQKLIYGSWNPLPALYPEEFLMERGFQDVYQLDPAARAALVEKFGPMVHGGKR